ncbi:MAG: hypothetical protein AAGJ82_09750 [Bacteroidota bacterium]
MKTHKFIFLLFVISGLLGCQDEEKAGFDCLPTNLQDGIIAFYPFTSGSLNDYSPNNYNLNNPTTAVTTTDRNDNASCAYLFDNLPENGEYLTIGKS